MQACTIADQRLAAICYPRANHLVVGLMHQTNPGNKRAE